MTLFESIGRALSPVKVNSPTYVNNGPSVIQNVGKPAVYPLPNVYTYLTAYNTNATVYTILTYITQKFGNVPRFCYTVEDEQAEKAAKWLLKQRQINFKDIQKRQIKAYGETAVAIDITPEGKLAALTARPNSNQGQDSYYAEAYLFYELTGEAFIWLNRGEDFGDDVDITVIQATPVLEKIVLPTQFVTIVPSRTDINTILYYRFEYSPGNFQKILPANMIHWKKTNPNYDGSGGLHLRGMSTLAAGLKLITQDNSATDAAVAMQQNQGAKGLLFNKSLEEPSPTQSGQIRAEIDNKINTTSRKGSVAFLGGADYGYLDMGQTSIDLQLSEAQQQVFIRLCNLFGVPPAIFLTETTYENLQQAGKSLLTNKILPACCSLRDEENRVLLPSFGLDPKEYTTDIDATLITELAEDMTQLSIQLTNSNWKTLNEKREAMGDEPLPDPNMDKVYISNLLVSLDDLAVNDELDSYSGMGNTNKPGSGLHEQTSSQESNAGNAGNAPKR